MTVRLAARGKTPAAFGRRCIPADCVAPPSNIDDIPGRRALSAGRLAALGATPAFHHGLLAGAICIVVALASAAARLQPSQPDRQGRVTAALPAGAALVLQGKDFGTLVSDWNSSPEKTAWLESANYRAFSRSRLFLRLKEAWNEFAEAAGIPPDMALLSEIAGGESALALYDIGKLEFVYVTRLPAARILESGLWRTRGSYEPRQAAGTPFYVRIDPGSRRTVAFGSRGDHLLLATREDLLAAALTLLSGAGGTSVEADGWFAASVRAAEAPGDLRLVMNLASLLKDAHVRSYWIQGNISELRQYTAAISDLFRSPDGLREERTLIRGEEKTATASPAVGEILRLVPETAGLFRAWAAPSGEDATNLVLENVIATSAAPQVPDRTAPRVASIGGIVGSEADLETTIDEESRAPRPSGYQVGVLRQLLGSEPLTAMLHVEATRAAADGMFVRRGSAVALARAGEWPQGAFRDALSALVDPVWTKAHIGMRWKEVEIGGQRLFELEGLEHLAVAERGRLVFAANDSAMLAAVLDRGSSPAVAAEASYAAGFRHGLERDRFAAMTRFLDHTAAAAENHEPLFFSENLASLSQTLARVESATSIVRDRGATVTQTVTYKRQQ